MFYVVQKVYCAKLQRKMRHATKKMISNYIKEFTKKIKKNTTQTIKSN